MKHYACTDLHGNYWAWKKIKEILKPEDKLYCLGDCIDRGADGIKIMSEILARPNTIYLKGNHEDMMYKSIIDTKDDNYSKNAYYYNWTRQNGGKVTYDYFINLPSEDQEKILNSIKEMPLIATYINQDNKTIIMSHAGFTLLKGNKPNDEDLLWDRSHFLHDWWDSDFSNIIILHGHTPTDYLVEEREFYIEDADKDIYNGYELIYCNKHKICLDCGTVYNNKVSLIDLDTLTCHHFLKEEVQE